MLTYLRAYFAGIFHTLLKVFLRFVTGHCELQRIIFKTLSNAVRSILVENSIKKSKTLGHLMREDVDADTAIQQILTVKYLRPENKRKFASVLLTCLHQINGYKRLVNDLETLRKVTYQPDNAAHRQMLMELWEHLRPDRPDVTLTGSHWTQIGFQGNDPATDFRGMGLLGLANLHYLACEHTELARTLLSHSQHPQLGFSFAIVGINITSLTLRLLNEGHLKTHFYNLTPGAPDIEHFHQLYCHLMQDFDAFWIASNPSDVMEFSRIKASYRDKLIGALSDGSTVLGLSHWADH